jgi:hypothetical protein
MGGEASLWVSKFLLDAGAAVDLEYMGHSEFEDRPTLVGSANRIAVAAKDLIIVTRRLVRPTYSEDVHFVCTDEQAETLLPEWDAWAVRPEPLDPTGYFRDDERDARGGSGDTIAWWALGEDLIWSREEAVADGIRGAFVEILENVS